MSDGGHGPCDALGLLDPLGLLGLLDALDAVGLIDAVRRDALAAFARPQVFKARGLRTGEATAVFSLVEDRLPAPRIAASMPGGCPLSHTTIDEWSNELKRRLALLLTLLPLIGGCAVVAVADAAVTVVATGVKVTAKAVGAAADAIIPDGDDDD